MLRFCIFFFSLFLSQIALCQNILRIAAYGGEIPTSLIHQFEQETGIKVYLTTFESNENLLLKLKSSKQGLYDLITPSHYYVERFKLFQMLRPIDVKKLRYAKGINPFFLNPNHTEIYGLPFVWGATGLFYNSHFIHSRPHEWSDLWNKRYKNKLLILDDTREVFSLALFALKRNPNTQQAKDIYLAYEYLLKLIPNIKLLASDAVPRIIADEDAQVGMAWNGDVVKIQQENPHIQFRFPQEGFIIWAECFAIPANSLHADNAYRFIDFMLNPPNAAQITKQMKYPVTIDAAKDFMPTELAKNAILYPPQSTLNRGVLQQDSSEKLISLYNTLWENFKMSF